MNQTLSQHIIQYFHVTVNHHGQQYNGEFKAKKHTTAAHMQITHLLLAIATEVVYISVHDNSPSQFVHIYFTV